MNANAVQVQKWLETVPSADSPRRLSSPAFPSWEAWASAGKQIDGVEDVLVQLMVRDHDPVKRAEAAMALGFVGADASVAALIGVLKSDAPQVAMEAAASLGRLGRADAVQVLCEALDNPDINVRANAATALGNFTSETARACLNRVAKDPDGFVRIAAEEALRRQRP